MSLFPLKHICYTQLNTSTWCATAQLMSSSPPQPLPLLHFVFDNPLQPFLINTDIRFITNWQIAPYTTLTKPQIAQSKRQQQQHGVRLLLDSLLTNLNIKDSLEESAYPYRLANNRYYVCFSHSSGKDASNIEITRVAVALSKYRAIGIDVEIQDIAWPVVQRFYHPAEIEILNKLPTVQRDVISKWLWQLKESNIKIMQYTLAQGLGKSYADIIPKLVDTVDKNCLAKIAVITAHSGYEVALLPSQQTLIVF
ncbi:peptide transporter [Psychrobacter sp. 16-MNA-CIBAN-0192]|uniref:4'-phosphopantetheinyl transferase family protein n=1 Tax=Psychrobacter sp. 16-MNA-CIBAN-0192 TaxID=3140448 RepID=UPI00332163D6